jgi:hypothetical protein
VIGERLAENLLKAQRVYDAELRPELCCACDPNDADRRLSDIIYLRSSATLPKPAVKANRKP